jgi:hypothetical protein
VVQAEGFDLQVIPNQAFTDLGEESLEMQQQILGRDLSVSHVNVSEASSNSLTLKVFYK